MRGPITRACALLAVAMASCTCALALDPSLDVSQYAHTTWKLRDGFVKGQIISLAQGSDGYLWIGTEFGLYRFDGVRAVPWNVPSGEQLPSNIIDGLLAARDGTLWIGTATGLASWKDGRLTAHPEMDGQLVISLLEDHEGTVWAGGIRKTNPAKLCAFRKAGVECRGGDGSLGPGIVSLYEDRKENLWAGALEGLWRWRPGPPTYFPVAADVNGIRGLSEDEQGALLVGARATGIGRLANGRITIEPLPGEQSLLRGAHKQPLRIHRMLRDHDGGLWIGTLDHGLIHLHNGRVDNFSQADGLSSDWVSSILEDREGNIWVATVAGLDRFRPYAVPTITVKQGLPSDAVTSVLAGKDGSVWLSTINGLSRWSQGRISIVNTGSTSQPGGMLNGQSPNSIFEDSSGRIWVSSAREFGYLENGRFVPVSNYGGGTVHGIVEDAPGHLWVASQSQGLLSIDHGKVTGHFPWTAPENPQGASALAPDHAGDGVWLGFYQQGGVAYFADGAVQKTYSSADGLGKGWVNEVRLGADGALWAATEGGLSRIRDGHIATLTSRNGLPCDAVHWTMEDDDRQLWLDMPCGLVRVARSDLEAWAADPTKMVRVSVFDALDGVQTHAFAFGYKPQVAKSADGRLWFVAGDGASVFDPHHLPFNAIPPPIHIERIVADGKEYDAGARVSLPARVHDLSIDYTALSLTVPEKVHFKVKLEGQDKDWRELVNVRHVEYTNLPPRVYRFRVMASNNSGVWNETGSLLDFSIAPAYYQTTWFCALCVVALLGSLWLLYQLRLYQLRQQYAMGLEERVGERMRIARELHDTLLQSIQGAVFQFQAARRLLLRRADNAMQVLDEAILAAEHAISEGRATIRDLRPEPVTQRDLPELLNATGQESADADRLNGDAPTFQVIIEGKPRPLSPTLQDELYRISREVVRNAFKHANAKRIEVEIRYDNDHLRLRIRDDGKGIDPKTLEAGGQAGHWGIPGIRERSQKIGAKLDFWSEVGAGTEVQLVVPASVAYEKHTGEPRFRLFRKLSGNERRF